MRDENLNLGVHGPPHSGPAVRRTGALPLRTGGRARSRVLLIDELAILRDVPGLFSSPAAVPGYRGC
jgi:hypothetical protein